MVTVIRPQDNFVFVHIPKCAGSSVRAGLRRALPDRGPDELWLDHEPLDVLPELGRVMPAHKPLPLLRDHYPDELAAYRSATCFAVLRNPTSRFKSAVQQHIDEFHNATLADLSATQLTQIIQNIITNVSTRPIFAGLEYMHFTRQIDYVDLDGERIVSALYPIESLEKMALDMTQHLGRDVDFNQTTNVSSAKDSQTTRVVRRVGRAVRFMVPEIFYTKLKHSARARLNRKPHPETLAVFQQPLVCDFVERFYAEDHLLYKTACAALKP